MVDYHHSLSHYVSVVGVVQIPDFFEKSGILQPSKINGTDQQVKKTLNLFRG